MIAPYLLKSLGYVISTVSVILLAIVSWQSASKQTALMICLIVGAASSIIGMALRWSSYALEKRRSGSGWRFANTKRAPPAKPATPYPFARGEVSRS